MNLKKTRIIEALILIGILCFAFYMAFIPHIDYEYPLHVDEWANYGNSQALITAQSITYVEPFLGERIVEDHPETGYHLFLSGVKLLTGLPWFQIFRIFPSVIFMLVVLSAYLFGRRGGFGLEAAFFVALVPTTVRFLGPAFLVPVALGMLFIPLVLFTLHHFEITFPKGVFLLLLLSFLFLMHVPTAIAVCLISAIYAFAKGYADWRAKISWWKSPAMIFTAILLSLLVVILRYSSMIVEVSEDIELMTAAEAYPLPLIADAYQKFGYISLVFLLVGVWFLSVQGKAKDYALVFCAAIFLAILLLFTRFNIGMGIMYDRSWLYFFILVSLVAAFGVRGVRLWCQKFFGRYISNPAILGVVLVLLLLIPSAWLTTRNHLEEPYYRIVDDTIYADFIWIAENIDARYQRAVLDPWLALTFPPIASRFVHTYSAFYPDPERDTAIIDVDEFFKNQCRNTEWLREHDISIVYTDVTVDNAELEQVHNHVYVLPR